MLFGGPLEAGRDSSEDSPFCFSSFVTVVSVDSLIVTHLFIRRIHPLAIVVF